MSAIKIVINPTNGRLSAVELVDSTGSADTENYLFLVYQMLAEEIQQFTKRTGSKVQLNKLLGKLDLSGQTSRVVKKQVPSTVLVGRASDEIELADLNLKEAED